MISLRLKLLVGLDRLVGLGLMALLVGAALAFGGAVWWARLPVAFLAAAVALGWLARTALAGSWSILRSPLAGLAALALGLAVVQILPLPVGLVGRISPGSVLANTVGVLPEVARADDPGVELPAPFLARVPLSLDRPATLRWLAGGLACLAVFWVASHFCDRLGHARVVWGSVVAAFFVNAVLGVVQVSHLSDGLYGFLVPGASPIWAPSGADLLAAPGATTMRPFSEAAGHSGARTEVGVPVPVPRFQFGTMMGGPGGFVALASLALPLALGLSLQLVAPRGGRSGLLTRLRDEGQGSQVAVLAALVLAGGVLVGIVGGPRLSLPIALAVLVVGIPGTWSAGLRGIGLAATFATLLSLGSGVLIGRMLPEDRPDRPMPRAEWAGVRRTWAHAAPLARDFPVVGIGLGSYPTVEPYRKRDDASATTAGSSLAQWAVESGMVGVGLLGLGLLWCLVRLPGSIRRVGTADRPLAFGLLGSIGGFALVSSIHWTVELPAIALAASAVAGTANRWLAGGTDLFVDRG